MIKKRSSLVGIVVVLVLVGLALALGACDSSGTGGDSSFVVSFTVDGTDYVLTEGYTGNDVFDSGANGSLSDGGSIYVGAAGSGVSAMDSEGPYVFLVAEGTTTGTYTSTDAAIKIFFGAEQIHYTINDSLGDPPSPDTRTITITEFSESVGGTIEGTFSGTLTGGDGSIEVTNGSFVVERLADEAVDVPGAFR
jgi:hypothetical protein